VNRKGPSKNEASVASPYSSAIIEHSPNGVLLVDKQTRIRFVNPAFRSMFRCQEENLAGEPAARFVHCDCFEKAIEAGGRLMVKACVLDRELCFRASLFPIEGEDLYCGIFVDVTEEEKAIEHLSDLRAQTLERAQEVISRQMKTAQEIARLLGETTAETKVLLVKLISLFEVEAK